MSRPSLQGLQVPQKNAYLWRLENPLYDYQKWLLLLLHKLRDMPANRPRRSKEPEQSSTPPTKGRLNNLELAGIGLICLAVLLYGISRCNRQPEPPSPTVAPTVTEEVVNTNTAVAQPTASPPTIIDTTNQGARELYVLVDSLRLRDSPALNGQVLGYLKYGEALKDLGEQTELKKLRVSIDETRTAPWIKVQTKKGKVGWTFGAYLQFYPPPRVTPAATE